MDYHNTQSYEVILNSSYQSDENNRNSTVDFSDFTLSQGDDNTLVIKHSLNNDDDFVPYTIAVEVWNTDDVQADPWVITQYPAMYIVGELNNNGRYNRFIYNKGGLTNNVYDDDWNTLGGVNNPSSSTSSNNNQNQYTIYITSFDIGDNYAIGDPRSETIDNLDYLQQQSDNENKQLTYYYPTIRENVNDIENHGSVVAPAFKVASSWGVVNSGSLTYETAQRRCASYQENGYPAGRWRLPTEGEIEYIVKLSDAGKIPVLFSGDYYASSGRYYDNESYPRGFHNDSEYGGHSVRCVYDVWYWGNEKINNPNQFTWGDEPRQ